MIFAARGAHLPILAAALGVAALFAATDGFRAVTSEGARRIRIAERPVPAPDVTLEAMDGRQLRLRPEGGDVALVEFIYTTCPTICQQAGSDFAALRDRIREDGLPARLISVSFDPERDDPEALSVYGEAHGADGAAWTVARPRSEDLPALLERFGVVVIPDNRGGYAHNAAIHLIDRKGRFARLFDIDAVEEAHAAVREHAR